MKEVTMPKRRGKRRKRNRESNWLIFSLVNRFYFISGDCCGFIWESKQVVEREKKKTYYCSTSNVEWLEN